MSGTGGGPSTSGAAVVAWWARAVGGASALLATLSAAVALTFGVPWGVLEPWCRWRQYGQLVAVHCPVPAMSSTNTPGAWGESERHIFSQVRRAWGISSLLHTSYWVM